MGVPTSEVGYTSVTTGRGDHDVHKGHVVALERKKGLGQVVGSSNNITGLQSFIKNAEFSNYLCTSQEGFRFVNSVNQFQSK
jgi:hypothetical protein